MNEYYQECKGRYNYTVEFFRKIKRAFPSATLCQNV